MRRALRWLGSAFALVAAFLAIAIGLLQTQPGKKALAAALGRIASSPDSTWAVDGLGGTVPFNMTARQITASASDGVVWLTLRDTRLEIDPADLLWGRLRVRLAQAGEIDQARLAPGPSRPLIEHLRVPHLPIGVAVDRLVIDRLALAPPVMGAAIVATVAGDATVERGAVRADLDIHRIDGSSGDIAMHATLAGAEPRLSLRLQANDPTGIVADSVLGRTDQLPFALAIHGQGPISDWHGRLAASAGPQARLDADFMLAVATRTILSLSARANMAPLLPPNLAPLVGDHALLSLHATFGERIVVDRLKFVTASGVVAGDATLGGPGDAVAVDLRADLPDAAKLTAITGEKLRGSAVVTAELNGSKSRPAITAALTATGLQGFGSRARSIEAQISATPTGALDDPQTRIGIAGHGAVAGLVLPEGGALAARIGQSIDWSLAATADRDGRSLDLARLDVKAGGINLRGRGQLAAGAHGVAGALRIAASASGLRTGVAAADALLGAGPLLVGTFRRDEAGILSVSSLALTGAAATLTGEARFDPAANPPSNNVAAALSLDIPRLEPLRPVLGTAIAGAVVVHVTAQGPLGALRLQTKIDGRRIAAGGASIDRVQISARIDDLSQPKAVIDGGFRAGRLDGRLGLTAAPVGNTGVAVSDLRLTAADGAIAGNLRVAFADGLVQGALTGRLPDLSRWSGLVGKPLGGSIAITAGLAGAAGGQGLDLSVNGARLAVGAGAASAGIGRIAATARLADLWRAPSGAGRLSVTAAHAGALDFSTGSANFSSTAPGRFAFQGSADGHPLSIGFAGEGGLTTGGAELRLSHLAGSLGNERFALDQPLVVSRRGGDLTLSPLALRFGPGRITATGSIRDEGLALTLNAVNLPLSAGAQVIGHPEMHGDLSLAATVGGSLRAPHGQFTVTAGGLSLAGPQQARTPRLGLTVEGDWDGRVVAARGQVTGLRGDRMAFSGSLPLLLSASPIGISVPTQGRLALSLQGGGDIGHLADLLPLGEDRLSGKFAADMSVSGTVAAPAAAGQLRLTDGRYQNFASGAVLTDLTASLIGNGDRFRLASLSAGDGAGGSLKAAGSFVLSGAAGPTAQLSATLANFRVAARDEAVATASGAVSVSGPLSALRVTAPLTIDRAVITLPNSLPPSVVVLRVTEINGRKQPVAPLQVAPPMLPVALDITLRMPGPVLVQGHGLDSQWSGRLTITGPAAAPKISGTLTANRGSYALLGKSFRLTRGTIAFDGTARIDPALDIVAEASAADITADVTISGYASAPTVTLSSTPPFPQDEILARLLFGTGVRQITAGQGLELAQAAAALAGGGPGVLDRLRGGLGLDWLRFGQGPAGAASSILNPSVVSPTAQSAAAVSAGKYIAPGVSVGVTQGVSPPTSKVTVEVDLGHHVTVDTEAGQNSGTGIGLNYNYDY